jgi:hypothetical protein
MKLDKADTTFLVDQLRQGNVVLFVGAGINENATNGNGSSIKSAAELEALLREKTSIPDPEVTLGDLVDEYRSSVGDNGLHKLFQDEFDDCTPSINQKKLLSYTWARIYTLNIDDALENIPRRDRVQKIKQTNRTDEVGELRHFDILQLVPLNGYIGNLDSGFVFTPSQYRSEIMSSSPWYIKCSEA